MTLLLLVAVALVFVVAIARHSRLGMTGKDKAGAKPKPLDSRFCGNDEQKQKGKAKVTEFPLRGNGEQEL